jgi:hypothetical protein
MTRITSPRYGISYPDPTLRDEPADGPDLGVRLVNAIERSVMYNQGVFANRPAFGIQGRVYEATDQGTAGIVYWDTGAAWLEIGPVRDGGISTAKLADLGVTLGKLAPDSVNASKIVDLSVGTAELAALAVTLAKMAANSVDSGKIVDGSVTQPKLAQPAVGVNQIYDGAIPLSKLDNSTLLNMINGREIAYGEQASNVVISATTEAGANTIVTASAFTFDGATPVKIEYYVPDVSMGAAAVLTVVLFEGSTAIGVLSACSISGSTVPGWYGAKKLTPTSGSKTYSIRGFRATANCTINMGAGGAGNRMPGYIRITKA